MNRRQAKKAFKKKYGQNPQKTFNEICNLFKPELIEALARAVEQLILNLQKWAEEATEALRKMIEGKKEVDDAEIH